MTIRITILAAFGLLVALALTDPVFAHAHLLSSSPAADSVTFVPPTELRLQFSEAPELALTTVTLTGSGQTVVTGAPTTDAGDGTIVVIPLIGLLTAGTYAIDWRAVAKDGHVTHGTYSFTLR